MVYCPLQYAEEAGSRGTALENQVREPEPSRERMEKVTGIHSPQKGKYSLYQLVIAA